eukprot:7711206-Lingulodinium_polyedra.AAC.1
MTRVLTAAGVPQAVLRLAPQIVEICRARRMRARFGPRGVATASRCVRCTERVQYDIPFYG